MSLGSDIEMKQNNIRRFYFYDSERNFRFVTV